MISMSEALAWLRQRADASGECDGCHADPKPLWQLPADIDHEPDAHFMYCRNCFEKIVRRELA